MKAGEQLWNEIECGAYTADLALWEELSGQHPGAVLELGCGAGRVVDKLARATGELVVGLDRDDELVAAVWKRTHGREHTGDAEIGDARGFELHFQFQLVLAPMQLIQLLGERVDRICCLACVRDHLVPGGCAAFALVEQMPDIPAEEAAPAIPDVRQVEEWVFSSLPLPPQVEEERIVLRRLRQTVDPKGAMSEEINQLTLSRISAETLESEAAEVDLRPFGRREIPATDAHVGSTVVLLERGQ
jgi:SAM-dependent methyltransferase